MTIINYFQTYTTARGMRKLFFFAFFIFCLSGVTFSQSSFTDKCEGIWRGQMFMFKEGVVKDSIEIVFTVAKTSDTAWTWKMEYNSPKYKGVKDYLLKLKDKTKNLYSIDEKDGIELNAYLFDNSLQCVFETEGTLLTSSYSLIDNKLVFAVSSGNKIDEAKNGVTNYSVSNLQKVILHKIK